MISNAQHRSPEEMRDDWLNEKIDVYSFGNLVYELLTGLWVFYENDDDEVVQVSYVPDLLRPLLYHLSQLYIITG